MSEAAGDVFTVEFECGNCGKAWSDSYPERTRVIDDEPNPDVLVSNLDCDEFVAPCDCCGPISCPNCKLSKQVEVAARNPIEEAA